MNKSLIEIPNDFRQGRGTLTLAREFVVQLVETVELAMRMGVDKPCLLPVYDIPFHCTSRGNVHMVLASGEMSYGVRIETLKRKLK